MAGNRRHLPKVLAAFVSLCGIVAAYGRYRRADPPQDIPPVVRLEPAPDLTPWLWFALLFALGAILYAGISGRRK